MSNDSSSSSSGLPGHPAPGQLVGGGRYELKRKLGQGGMGVVWLAHDQRLQEDVALKFLPPEISNDPIALDDMRRETRKSHKLAHPNIIRIHDLCESPGEPPFISMEFVDGQTLSAVLAQQPNRVFTWEKLQPIFRQLCDALAYAHSEDVIHRDLKPGNMMLDARGRLKLADFGIAAVISESGSRVSVRHLATGTVTHMSPQQMDGGLPCVTDDIYALGATLYELLSGRPPFHGGDVAHQVRTMEAKPLEHRQWELQVENPVPPEVAAIAHACVAKDPSQRPQSVQAVAEAIGLQAATATQPLRTESAPAIEPVEVIEVAPTPKPMRWPIWVGVAAVLAIVAGILLKATSGKAPSSAQNSHATNATEVAEPADPEEMTAPPTAASGVARPQGSPGSLDESFQSGSGDGDKKVYAFRVLPNGQVIVAGDFTLLQGIPRHGIARLNANGTIDTTFTNASIGGLCRAHALAVQTDGKILTGGSFKTANGTSRDGVARFFTDGTLDSAFAPHFLPATEVYSLALQPDGKIVVGGMFTSVNGQPIRGLARLLPTGAIDPDFKIGAGVAGKVHEIVIRSDGRIVIAGGFRSVGGETMPDIARLNPDGTPDTTFQPRVSFATGKKNPGKQSPGNDVILGMKEQPDGKLIIGGNFTKIANTLRARIARLNADGTLDDTFDPGKGVNDYVQAIFVQPDGKILIGGGFKSCNSVPRYGVARLNANGALDTTFDPGNGANSTVQSIEQLADHKILLSGGFSAYNGTARCRVARLFGDSPASAKKQ